MGRGSRGFMTRRLFSLVFGALAMATGSGHNGPTWTYAGPEGAPPAWSTLDPSYADPAFDDVLALLRAVPADAREHASAKTLADEIAAGRAKHTAMKAQIDASMKVPVVVARNGPAEKEARTVVVAVEAPAEKPAPKTVAAPVAAAQPKRRPNGPIIIYTTAWCGYCKKAKAFMREKQVSFIERDIEADASYDREAKAKRAANNLGSGVPMIDVDGAYMVGYSAESLGGLLEKQGFL